MWLRKTKSFTTAAKNLSASHRTRSAPKELKLKLQWPGEAGDITENLLSWIGHLSAKESQRLEALADGVDVGHSHKHHLTVGIVFCRCERWKQWFKQKSQEAKRSWFLIIVGRTNRLDEHTTCIYPLLSVHRENEDLPGHSQPPPLALLATAAAYDLASRISNLWGWMASVSTSELLVMDDSEANTNPHCAI